MEKAKRILKYVVAAVVVLFVLIQFVPSAVSHTNPPVVREPNWDSPQTRELAARACFDCHSNETKWPWYSNIAPISWEIEEHVEEGREHLNFSDWGNKEHEEGEEDESEEIAEEIAEEIEEGKMPLPNYLPLHPEAQLTDEEKVQLIQGLMATVKNTP